MNFLILNLIFLLQVKTQKNTISLFVLLSNNFFFFAGFIPNSGHKAEELFNAVIKMMELHNLKYEYCRGQSYDNAANMSGMYSGLQTRIQEICLWAYWIPCAAHSLNLIGEQAACSCKDARDFFGLLSDVYTFFAIPTARWNGLKHYLSGSTLKQLSATRWSARAQACKSMNENYFEVMFALEKIKDDSTVKSTIRCQAEGLWKKLQSLETAIMFAVWTPILSRYNYH